MNQLTKLLPLLFSRKGLGDKRLVTAIVAIVSLYQLFAPYGLGSNLGVPSYDTFYKEPRDILVDRVENARDVQVETAEEFKSALQEFKEVTGFAGGDLEAKFNQLSSAFERSESAAKKVDTRVDKVVGATNRLLKEWRTELDDYHDDNLRRRAETQFDQTRADAEQLIAAMRKAQQKTEPVLSSFRDQMLYMKHNLNMQAISALDETNIEIQDEVASLIRDMEASIAEAEAFIKTMI